MRTAQYLLAALPFLFAACSSKPAPEKAVDPVVEDTQPEAPGPKTGPLDFTAPEGWTERAPTGAMRFKEYVLGEVTKTSPLVIVAYWPNGVGPLQANLDRWKNQVGGGEDAAEPTLETFTENGLISTILDGQGDYTGMKGGTETGSRLLAAYVESPSGRFEGVYTIKLNGSIEALEPWAESFRKFIQDL